MGYLIDGFNQLLFEIQRADEFYKNSRDHLQQIISSMSDVVLVTNSKGNIKTVNPAALSTLGYKRREMIDQFISYFLIEQQGDSTDHVSFEELISQDFSKHSKKVLIGKGDKKIPVSFSGSVMRDSNGALQGVVCVAHPLQ